MLYKCTHIAIASGRQRVNPPISLELPAIYDLSQTELSLGGRLLYLAAHRRWFQLPGTEYNACRFTKHNNPNLDLNNFLNID